MLREVIVTFLSLKSEYYVSCFCLMKSCYVYLELIHLRFVGPLISPGRFS